MPYIGLDYFSFDGEAQDGNLLYGNFECIVNPDNTEKAIHNILYMTF